MGAEVQTTAIALQTKIKAFLFQVSYTMHLHQPYLQVFLQSIQSIQDFKIG